MKELLTEIVTKMVNHPGQVAVNERIGSHTIMLELSVAKPDFGAVLGKRGRNIDALRTIINAASSKYKKRIVVDLME